MLKFSGRMFYFAIQWGGYKFTKDNVVVVWKKLPPACARRIFGRQLSTYLYQGRSLKKEEKHPPLPTSYLHIGKHILFYLGVNLIKIFVAYLVIY